MSLNLNPYTDAFRALPDGIAWAEVNADWREDLSASVADGRQASCESLARTAVYLRVSDGQRTGMVYTEQLEEDPLALMKIALENARFVDADSAEQPPPAGGVHLGEILDESDMPDMVAAGIALEAAALAAGAAVQDCDIRRTTQMRKVAASSGLESSLTHRYFMATLRVELPRENGKRVHATASASAPCLRDIDLAALAQSVIAKADRSDASGTLSQVSIPSGKYPCVLSAEAVGDIMITAWQEFTAANMGGGKSIFQAAPGTEIGSPCLSIVDGPTHPDWGYNLALDSEGNPCTHKDIVRNGRLVTPLHTRKTAADSGLAPTGNAGRVALLSGMVPVNIITIPSILYIEPQTATEAQLVAQMGSGLLLTYALDPFHAINITSGEYSIPCGGVLYEDGRPVGTVAQITIAGNLRDLFCDIRAVGGDLRLHEFHYKNYCFGGPSILVGGLNVSSDG